MGLFDLFSRKRKEAVSKNWLEDGSLIVEKLLEATKRKDIRSLKKLQRVMNVIIFNNKLERRHRLFLIKLIEETKDMREYGRFFGNLI